MDPNRRRWNDEQRELQYALDKLDDLAGTIQLFLEHHAGVHSSRLSAGHAWSFEDEALEGLEEADYRVILPGEDHSIAWNLWHLARIEDVTMNVLAAGESQVFLTEGWKKRIGFDSVETGNALDSMGIRQLSAEVDVDSLREYRMAVGKRTRQIVMQLTSESLRERVQSARLEQVFAEGAVVESTRWLAEYWGKKTVAGLLLMPPTRHNFVHLNEAGKIRKKVMGKRL